jgi:hypothetical protein
LRYWLAMVLAGEAGGNRSGISSESLDWRGIPGIVFRAAVTSVSRVTFRKTIRSLKIGYYVDVVNTTPRSQEFVIMRMRYVLILMIALSCFGRAGSAQSQPLPERGRTQSRSQSGPSIPGGETDESGWDRKGRRRGRARGRQPSFRGSCPERDCAVEVCPGRGVEGDGGTALHAVKPAFGFRDSAFSIRRRPEIVFRKPNAESRTPALFSQHKFGDRGQLHVRRAFVDLADLCVAPVLLHGIVLGESVAAVDFDGE